MALCVIPRGRRCCLVKFSILLQGRGPCPEQGKRRGRKQVKLGSAQWKTKPLQAQLCPWALNKNASKYGPGMQCGKQHLAVCLSVQPSSCQRGLCGFYSQGDLQSAVKNIIERNIQCGDAVFKVFVQSGICAAKCDIVAKVTVCLLFWQRQNNTEYRQTLSFCFHLHSFIFLPL